MLPTTQADFDEIVERRIARERAKARLEIETCEARHAAEVATLQLRISRLERERDAQRAESRLQTFKRLFSRRSG
jgi:hypothetical protein